ncbi:MAG: hypothetical protein R2882_10600 [Gemmatimonadales bacterium]
MAHNALGERLPACGAYAVTAAITREAIAAAERSPGSATPTLDAI